MQLTVFRIDKQTQTRSYKTLPSQVFECSLAHDVSLDIFAFDVMVWPESLILRIFLQLIIQCDRVLNLCDLLEVCCIRNLQASHPKCMPPLLEVTLKSAPSPIRIITTNFAFILDTEAVKLVKPKGNGFTIPTEGQVEWIVYRSIFVIHFCLHFFSGLTLLFLYISNSFCNGFA